MIPGYGPVTQALLGTLFTWGLTAAGAGCVFFIRGKHRKLLDVSLGFAAGVMTAASYWSLLEPAIEMCETSGLYGDKGQYAFAPVAVGFLFGAIFVYGTDKFLDYLGLNSTNMMMTITKTKDSKEKLEDLEMMTALRRPSHPTLVTMEQPAEFADFITNQHTAQRRRGHHHSQNSLKTEGGEGDSRDSAARALEARQSQWKRIMLLVVAITVHNIPEGLAVGVGFGAAASSSAASFHSARNLALGIGIQNFPEGLAVSLPLQSAGFSVWRAFCATPPCGRPRNMPPPVSTADVPVDSNSSCTVLRYDVLRKRRFLPQARLHHAPENRCVDFGLQFPRAAAGEKARCGEGHRAARPYSTLRPANQWHVPGALS